MKKLYYLIIVSLFLLVPYISFAGNDLSKRLSGRILLQVESSGEAWYVEPTTQERAFLGRPDDAFKIMRELGLGIAEKDFNSFKEIAPQRLSGRILLRVEAKGEAYYVNPVDLKMHFLGRPTDAFSVMRQIGLGITNQNIEKVPVFQKYAQQTKDNADAIKILEEKLLEQNNKIKNLEGQLSNALVSAPVVCSSWVYSNWSDCQSNGLKSRNVLYSLPSGCLGGSPILSQSCLYVAPTCTSWKYSNWSDCSDNGKQTRDILSSAPINCVGGSTVLTRSCDPVSHIEYSPYILNYRSEEYQGNKVVDGQEVEINKKGNITIYLKTSSRDIRIKKIVINTHNATPEQIVGIKYNGGWFHDRLKQLDDIRWEFDTEIEAKKRDGGDEFDIQLFASGPYGLDAIIEPLFEEWEVWDYTSNKPVKMEAID